MKLTKNTLIEGDIQKAGLQVFIIDEKEVDIDQIISDIGNSFSGSNEEQMKAVNLLKGLATSDEAKANEFMKKLDKATTDISKEMTKE